MWKCCSQYASKFGNLSSGHRTGQGQFSFQAQGKAVPKNAPLLPLLVSGGPGIPELWPDHCCLCLCPHAASVCLCSLPSLRSCKDTHLWWLLGPIQIVCLGYRHLQILNLVTFAKTSFLDKESESRSVVSNSLRTVQSMEFFRPEHWSRLLFPSPGDLPKGSKPGLLHCRGSFTNWTIRFLDEVILKNSGG